MTEQEWLACTDPMPMLKCLRNGSTDRKLRLLAVACCRVVWDSLVTDQSRRAVEAAEQYADDLSTEITVERAYLNALDAAAEYTTELRGGRLDLRGPTVVEGRLRFAGQTAHPRR